MVQTAQPLPAHVPPELVRPFPYILGATTSGDPFAPIAEIHRGPDVFWAERVVNGVDGAWVPRRAEDIRAVFFDNEHFSIRGFPPFARLLGESWYLVPVELDPPEHGLFRSAFNPLFTPKRMALLEDKIRLYACDYIERFRERGRCEFMRDFAFEFPIKVFLELMGLPQDRLEQFLAWEHCLLHDADLERLKQATREVNAYLREECDDRRRNPRDDLITFGVEVEVGGRRMTDDELTGFCFNLFIGGLDTVSTNLGLIFRHLAEHPADQARLRENPRMIPHAIDEMMRAYPCILNSRECIKDTTLGGVAILRGDKVMLPTFLAGRDPDEFPEPERVILDRQPRHVTFGYGVHLCIGMHLARREMRIAMEEFLAAIDDFAIEPGAVIESYLAAIIQPIALPLVWSPGPAGLNGRAKTAGRAAASLNGVRTSMAAGTA
jgi:cytochrome P450